MTETLTERGAGNELELAHKAGSSVGETARSVVFRADASVEIGSGHVRRCVVLAETLAEAGWHVSFASRPGSRAVVPALSNSSFGQIDLAAGADEVSILQQRAPDGCDLLVVDHYGLDAEFCRAGRDWARRILVIDDLANRRHECDVLVDQTPGRDASEYEPLVPPGCRILGGAEYALIDRRFRGARARMRKARGAVRRILVNFGGTDPVGATTLTLEALARAGLGVEVDVVMGSASPDVNRVRELAAALAPRAEVHTDVADMAAMMSRADLAIGAGGTTSLERCCLGLPTLMIVIADNQRKIARELADRGAAISIGEIAELDRDTIARRVRTAMTNESALVTMGECAAHVTDGRGAMRVAVSCYPDVTARGGEVVTLRPALEGDADVMFAWQSAPGIRAFSRNPDPPKRAEHERWFRHKLSDPSCVFSIVLHRSQPVGALRFDGAAGGDSFEVSILIAAEYQGHGIGAAALDLGKRLLPGVQVCAWIQPRNIASMRMFERAGYVRIAEDKWMLSAHRQR